MYLFFAAIILAATLTALRWSRRLYGYGRSFVRLEDGSASVRRRLKGTLTIPRPLPPGTIVQIELICTRTSSTAMTGVDRWNAFDKAKEIDSRTRFDSIRTVSFDFEIPDNATPTTPTHQTGSFQISYAWSLTATSATSGVDYWAKFVIPIAAAPAVSQPAL